MTSLIDALQKALGDTYTVERELGGGGMARVFIAVESALGRRVAIKVLPPELVETVSADRFQREIQVAANLHHPHIVPLLTAGHAGGLLYYTMPLVEGETLRSRLAREGELPVADVCHIMTEVARALSHAHRQRVVHRDIKPENILLSEGEAQVADFGIAKALAASTEGDNLTTRGLVLGTPAYMAPEQAAGDAAVDARSDLYALGVVAYEMLTSLPPFSDRAPQALMAAHAVRRPEPVAERRPAIPDQLAALVMQMLEKHPADRPQSADEVLRRLEAISLQANAVPAQRVQRLPTPKPTSARLKGRWSLVGGAAALALLGVVTFGHRTPPKTKLDPQVVAVVPFRVSGADSSLRYLREGMLDLLATKLSGTEHLRAVDSRTLLHAWRDGGGTAFSDLDRAGVENLARTVGAGRVLEGEVIGTPQHVVLTARISGSAGEDPLRGSVEGPSDSLTSLVDRLTAQLLVFGSGEPRDRLSALTTTSLPALRAYLDGRAAYHKGDYYKARDLFAQAIEIDSSFALAGLGHRLATTWTLGEGDLDEGARVAWRHRDRLSRRDLLLLYFWLGRRNPILAPQSESMETLEALLAAAPDSPEAWALLGDHAYHYGSQVGMSDPLRLSLQAYKRALSLDSTFAPAREHLHELYYQTGDQAGARQALIHQFRIDSTSPSAAVARWFALRILGDTVLGKVALSDDSLLVRARSVVRLALEYGRGLADAESVLTLRGATVSNSSERETLKDIRWTFYVARGQPTRAEVGMRQPVTSADRTSAILGALYADSDSATARKAAAIIPRVFTRPSPQTDNDKIWEQYAVAQYDLMHGSSTAARQAVQVWKGLPAPPDTSFVLLVARNLAMLLDVQLAALAARPDALERLVELDSVLQTAPTSGSFEWDGNLIVGQLWSQRGDYARALASVRRRVVGLWDPRRYIRCFYIPSLLDEARYAALTGDRPGAVRAYRHYLRLRSDPEPAIRRKVDQVRAELIAFERAPDQ